MDLVHSEAVQNKALTQSTILFHNARILMVDWTMLERRHLFYS